MQYTTSDSFAVQPGSGRRLHDDTKAIPTALSADDVNQVTWSLMAILEAANVNPASFNKDNPDSFGRVLQSLRILFMGKEGGDFQGAITAEQVKWGLNRSNVLRREADNLNTLPRLSGMHYISAGAGTLPFNSVWANQACYLIHHDAGIGYGVQLMFYVNPDKPADTGWYWRNFYGGTFVVDWMPFGSATVGGGFKGYATKAAMNADLTPAAGSLALVTNDPVAENNSVYLKVGASGAGSWSISSSDRLTLLSNRLTQLESTAYSYGPQKNRFDPSQVINGQEVYGDGSLAAEPQSVSVDNIRVDDCRRITLSGFQLNAGFNRYFAFLNLAKNQVLKVGQFSGAGAVIEVPEGAVWLRCSLKQRIGNSLDASTVQIESGHVATLYEPYRQRILSIAGKGVGKDYSVAELWEQRAHLYFGDSITETCNVEAGDFSSGTYRSNWPVFTKADLRASRFRCYARSGASLREYSGQLTWQKLSHQIEVAYSNAEVADVIAVAVGTNDGVDNLGTFSGAMGKSFAALDMAVTADALRFCLTKIRQYWPQAICNFVLPLQRADRTPESQEPLYVLLRAMAARFGFKVIDATHDTGIIAELEVNGGPGTFLVDGLHPNPAGQRKQANLISASIKAAFNSQ